MYVLLTSLNNNVIIIGSHDLIAEQTHEIPLEGVDKESVADYRLLIDEMLKFVSHDQINFPPLFVKVTM